MFKQLFKLTFFFACLGIITALVAAFLLATEGGSRWLVHRVIDHNDLPLTIEAIEGRLLDEINFHDIHFDDRSGNEMKAKQIGLAWSIADLSRFHINVKTIDIDQLTIIAASDREIGTTTLPEIEFPALPVTIQIDNLAIDEMRIISADSEHHIKRIRAAIVLNKDKFELRLEDVRSAGQQFTGVASLLGKELPEIDMNIAWSGLINDEHGEGSLQLNGPKNNLALELGLDSIIKVQARGILDLSADPPAGHVKGKIEGDILQTTSEQLKLVSPVQFNFKGDTEFLDGHFATRLQLGSEETLDFEMETHASLPGDASRVLNIDINWMTTPEQGKSLLMLSGIGNIEYQDSILTIYHQLITPYAVNLTGNIDFAKGPELDLRLDWQDIQQAVSDDKVLRLPSGILDVDGTPEALAILVRTHFALVANEAWQSVPFDENAFVHLVMEGKLDTTTGIPTGELTGTVKSPVPSPLDKQVHELEPFHFTAGIGSENIELQLTGTGRLVNGESFTVEFDSKTEIPKRNSSRIFSTIGWSVSPREKPGLFKTVNGKGKLDYLDNRITVSHELLSPFPATLEGDVTFFEDMESILRFDAGWQDMEITLADSERLKSDSGQIHVNGSPSSLSINLDSRFQSTPVGPISIEVKADWKPSVMDFRSININILDGNVNGTGYVALEDITRGQFDLGARNINLGAINPDLVSRIDLEAILDFNLEDDELYGRLQVPSLSGEWRGYPLQGNASIFREANRIHIESLQLASGSNKIDMQLNIKEPLAGYLDVSVTDMSVFSSELAGSINGRFDIGGSLKTPRLDGQLKGKDIYAFDLRIATIDADTLIDLRPQQNSSIDIRSSTLQYGKWVIDELTFEGKGLTESHTLELVASGKDLQLNAGLGGKLRNNHWQGALKQLIINTPNSGQWKLDRSSQLSWQVETSEFYVGDSCLVQESAGLCVMASGSLQNDKKATIQLARLPMNLARRWLPNTVSLNGTVSGDIHLKSRQEHWEIQTRLNGENTQVIVGFEDNEEKLDVEKVSLLADISEFKREWNLQLGSPGYFDISMEGSMQNTGEKPLSTDIKIDLHKIDWLANIEPALTESKGKFEARIQASGSIGQPRIAGQFNLREGQLNILPVGLKLDQVSGNISSGNMPDRILIHTILGNGDKQLAVDGHATLDAAENFPYQLNMHGKDFPVVRMADMTMDISPNLDLYGSMELHHVRGDISIPLLELQVTSLPKGSVSVSPDTVIVQSKEAGGESIQTGAAGDDFMRNLLDIDVHIKLGQGIHIQGFGLNTKLTGDINIIKPVGIYQPRGEGFLTITEGSYRAYGQNLVIKKGHLQFAGPLDNPAVSIRAYRPNLKVRPGVKVDGNVRQPRLSLYSEPALSEADTLSYLITGRPISGVSSNEDANLLMQAALALGTQESAVLTSEIESTFGLEEFSVAAGESYESASISATKRLSPNLTFSPSFNPFDQIWLFILNYRLTDHWSVQTESGISQGGEIIYSIETNKLSDLFKNIWTFDY